MKLEMNTELRAKVNDFIQGALFVDAGNVWMYKDEVLYGADGVFGKDFYKQLAVGAGVGLRFDFTYLLLRFI
jgi:outer membrane protein assembly factor BamA